MTPDRAARLHAAADRQFGELLTYQPMAANGGDVNGRPVSDGARVAVTLTAIWVEPHVEGSRRPRLDMSTVRQGGMRQVSAGRPAVKFSDGALPYPAQLGDRLQRLLTGEFFEVADIGGDGFGRTVLGLSARAGQPAF